MTSLWSLGTRSSPETETPAAGPAPISATARVIGSRLANRFLGSYQEFTGNTIDPDRLAWGRRVHAVRALVELSTWDAQNTIDAQAGHPWFALRPHFEAQLTR